MLGRFSVLGESKPIQAKNPQISILCCRFIFPFWRFFWVGAGAIYKGSQVLANIPKIKFIWKLGMEVCFPAAQCLQQECGGVGTGEGVFAKYKLGLAHLKAPFRLFESSCSTSCEEEWESDSRCDRKARGPYRKYTFEEKLQAVQRILNGEDVKLISREFGIPRRNLLRWKKNGCERKEGGGRPTDAALEQLIHHKIKSQELTDERAVRSFAMEYSRTSSFKASKGWFLKFCHRFAVALDAPDSPSLPSLPSASTLTETLAL